MAKTVARKTSKGRKKTARKAAPARKKASGRTAKASGTRKAVRKTSGATKATGSRKKAGSATGGNAARKKAGTAAKATGSRKKAGQTTAVRKTTSRKTTSRKAASRKTTAAKGATTKKTGTARRAAARKAAAVTLDPLQVAAWRMTRQGLDQQVLHPPRDLSEAVTRCGWLAVPDGATPYLALVARFASFGRHDLDRNLFQEGNLMEVPGMRGQRVVVPPSESWLALQAFRPRVDALLKELLSRYRVMTRAALMNLEDVVRAVLAGQSLSVETLRTRVPSRLVKELGAAGARHGLLTSVDLALWHLWCQGEVVSRPVERRLDRRRREYLLRRDLLGPVLSADIRMRPEEDWRRAMAVHFFRWVGLARSEDLAWWADSGAAETRACVRSLELVPVSLRGLKGTWYMAEAELDGLQQFAVPDSPAIALVPCGDLFTSAWRSFEGLMAPEDLAAPLAVGRGGEKVRITHPAPADHHFVIIGGRVAGSWSVQPSGQVKTHLFRQPPSDVQRRLKRQATTLGEFIGRDLPALAVSPAIAELSPEGTMNEPAVLSSVRDPRE